MWFSDFFFFFSFSCFNVFVYRENEGNTKKLDYESWGFGCFWASFIFLLQCVCFCLTLVLISNETQVGGEVGSEKEKRVF